jgi:photosystem II stability/assembly factor-like uncharacterized protein
MVIVGLVVLVLVRPNEKVRLTWQEKSLSLKEEVLEEKGKEEKFENPIRRAAFEFNQLKDPVTGEIPAQIKRRERLFVQQEQERLAQSGRLSNEIKASQSTQSSSSNTFVNRGPWNVGGRTRALAIDVSNENIILAGGISGGVWRTTDQGDSWSRTSALDQHPAVSTIVQDRREGQTNNWYYGTGERRGNSASASGGFYFGNGVYKSTDNGQNWSLIPNTAVSGTSGTDPINQLSPFTATDEMAIDYSNSSEAEIYVAGAGEIIRTTNDFQTFTTVLGSTNNGNNMTDVLVNSSGVVYATIGKRFSNGSSGEDGVWRSSDGLTWEDITPSSGFENGFWRLELAIDPQNENLLYVVSDEALMRWDDSSKQWTDLSESLEIPSDPDDRDSFTDYTTQTYYDQLVAVHPGDSNTVFIGGTNLFRSGDAFATVQNKELIGGYRVDNHHPDQHKVVFFDSDPDMMLSGNDGGVHLTFDSRADTDDDFPVTWESLNNGYLSTQFYQADINNVDYGDPLVIGGMQDNGTYIVLSGTINPQEEWTFIGGGDGAWAHYTYNAFYHSSQNGFIDRREIIDNTIQNPIDITPLNDAQAEEEFLFINPYEYNNVNQDQMVIGGLERAFFTPDVRTNPGVGEWIEISSPDLIGSNANISAMSFSEQPEGVLYMGTDFGDVLKVTETQSITQDVQAIDLPTGEMPGGYIGAIKADPLDADHVVVTFTNYGVISIWESIDGGQTWSSISGNLEENPDGSGVGPSVRSFEIIPDGNGGNYYFAGTSVGLFMTQFLDGDNTEWTQQSTDLIGEVVISWIRVRPIDGFIMVATHGNGVFTGNYEVGKNAFVNYSYNEEDNSYLLRANRSFSSEQGLGYQWVKNDEDIEGANDNTLSVTDGGVYQVRLFFSQTESTLSNSISINIDGKGPEIISVKRSDPTEESTSESAVVFEATFDEPVFNVDASDFESSGNASAQINNIEEVTPNIAFLITLDEIAGSGELGLSIVDNTDIADESGNLFSGVIQSAETYTIIDASAPTAAVTRLEPTTEVTNQNEVSFQILFSERVVNFGLSDLEFMAGSVNAAFGNLRQITEGLAYEINIIEIEEDGLIGIDFASNQDVEDESGNPFSGELTENETFTIENIITSIDERYMGQSVVVDKNPSDGLFYIGLPSDFVGDFTYAIINANGSKMRDQKVLDHQSNDQILVDIRNVSDGIYLFRAIKEDKKLTVKLIKRAN